MKLKKFLRNENTTAYKIVLNPEQDDGGITAETKRSDEVPELPTPECDTALQALVQVVGEVMEYTKGYLAGINIIGFSLLYTTRDTRSMLILFTKRLDKLAVDHRQSTPAFRIESPAEGEAGKIETKAPELCIAAIEEAEQFIIDPTQRQQPPLPMGKPDGNGEDEDPDQGKII